MARTSNSKKQSGRSKSSRPSTKRANDKSPRGKSSSKKTTSRGTNLKSEKVRLNKFIADSGIASRRKADELIDEGLVKVNGRTVYELGIKVNPKEDTIVVKGKVIKPQTQKVYAMFFKPKNVVTSMSDPQGRPTVSDFFSKFPVRVFPVGRLDWDTEGLLLMTNDGEFAQSVSHPKEEVPKTYLAKLSGKPTSEQLDKLKKGVSIVGGKVAAKSLQIVKGKGSSKKSWVRIVITEGKNRQVRRMFEKIGFDVEKLQRIAIGKLTLGQLQRGEYKILTESSLQKIFQTTTPSKRQSETRSKPKALKSGKKSPRRSQRK